MTTLISTTDGLKFLQTEDPLLKQIVECLEQIDPVRFGLGLSDRQPSLTVYDPRLKLSGATTASATSADLVFSKTHMDKTISFGYLEMLGTLSRYPDGIEYAQPISHQGRV